MKIENILFDKPKNTGFRIGFIALILIAFALIIPTFISIEGISETLYPYQTLLIGGLVMTIFFSTMMRNKTKTTITEGINPTTVSKQIMVLTIGIIAGLILVAVNALTGIGTNLLLASSFGEIPAEALYLGILAGVAEELFFRGFIQTMIRVYVPSLIFAIVPTALIFALFHFFAYSGTTAFVVLFALGIVLGLLHEIFNDIGVPMIAHIVNNIFAMMSLVIAVITGNIIIVLFIAGIIIAAYLYAAKRSE